LMAILLLVAHDLLTYRTALQGDVISAASVIAQNSTAALAFQDQSVATHNLMGLAEKPNIRAACIYDHNGKIFASYTPTKDASFPAAPDQRAGGLMLDRLVVYRPVMLDKKPVGAIYIESSLKELGDRLKAQVIMFVIVLIISGLIAFLISARL